MSVISKISMKDRLNVRHSNNNRIWRSIAATTGVDDRLLKIKSARIDPAIEQVTDDGQFLELA
jgi:hypothetical protein